MEITERAAYLKGLADGLGLQDEGKEGKILTELLSLVGDMADKIAALDADNKKLREYVEELDQDLGSVEEDLYVDDGDDYDEDDEEEDDTDEDDEDMDDDSGYYELICPSCGEHICFDDSLEPDELVCPACGQKVKDIELCDGDCGECDEKCDD